MNNMITRAVLLILSCFSITVYATSGKATIEVTAAKSGDNVKVQFKTIPAAGLAINDEGPWKLEIKSATGLKPAATEVKRADWKKEIAGFDVVATPDKGAKKAQIHYKMTTFVCTKDKSQCFREVVENKADLTF